MTIKVIITRDFDHMSEVAAEIVKDLILKILKEKEELVFGLATGHSPTGLYKKLTRFLNSNDINTKRFCSFNLDEYIGLPGENSQQKVLHPESYCYFMIQEFFGLLNKKFRETYVPFGNLIDQKVLKQELDNHPNDYTELGKDAGRSIVIKENSESKYLAWIRESILNAYLKKIEDKGGIDLQVIGVGGRGHVAFHESGIPFEGSDMMLIKLDENTINNAIKDGHFSNRDNSPHYAISMGAELVYKARNIILLASGRRKTDPVAESLLNIPTPEVPISYGQKYSEKGGNLIYILDKIAAQKLMTNRRILEKRGIELKLIE
ncbi:MAG: 6-phosphogluconolactonase [Promethearchaeota archaeon]|nr:MAG: 6-phosphogluconolactonase [Candidatus Lokiarchaeota archaeon]